MNNLFMMHTQYNLIIALGVIQHFYLNDNNYLILNAEFPLSNEMLSLLNKNFKMVWVLQSEFYSKSGIYTEINIYKRINKFHSMTEIMRINYDRAFLTQEEYVDTYIISQIKHTSQFKLYNIEEDIYFSRYEETCLKHSANISFKKKVKKVGQRIFHDLIYGGNPYFESDVFFYGMNSHYDGYYVLYPDLVRKDIKNNNAAVIEVSKNDLVNGINALYPTNPVEGLEYGRKIWVFLFDLISRYRNVNSVKKVVSNILLNIKSDDLVLIKYHPRETNKFDLFDSLDHKIEVPNILPSEKLLSLLYGRDVCVIGNASCAILVSAKIGFRTISMAQICEELYPMALNAMRSMGIFIPETVDGILKGKYS